MERRLCLLECTVAGCAGSAGAQLRAPACMSSLTTPLARPALWALACVRSCEVGLGATAAGTCKLDGCTCLTRSVGAAKLAGCRSTSKLGGMLANVQAGAWTSTNVARMWPGVVGAAVAAGPGCRLTLWRARGTSCLHACSVRLIL